MEYFEQAHENGYVAATNGLASKYLRPGKNKNLTKAFELFKHAANAGSSDGYQNLANLILSGGYNLTVFRHLHNKMKRYQGIDSNLGIDYSRPAAPNIPLAVHTFAEAAERGHFQALQTLGSEYGKQNGWLAKYFHDQQYSAFQTVHTTRSSYTEASHPSQKPTVTTLSCKDRNTVPVELEMVRLPTNSRSPANIGYLLTSSDGFVQIIDIEESSLAYKLGVRNASVITHVQSQPVVTVTRYKAITHGLTSFTIRVTAPSFSAALVHCNQRESNFKPNNSISDSAKKYNPWQSNPLVPMSHHQIIWPQMVSVTSHTHHKQLVLPLKPSCEVAAFYLTQAAYQGHTRRILDRALNAFKKTISDNEYGVTLHESEAEYGVDNKFGGFGERTVEFVDHSLHDLPPNTSNDEVVYLKENENRAHCLFEAAACGSFCSVKNVYVYLRKRSNFV